MWMRMSRLRAFSLVGVLAGLAVATVANARGRPPLAWHRSNPPLTLRTPKIQMANLTEELVAPAAIAPAVQTDSHDAVRCSTCCPEPCIVYRTRGHLGRKCYGREPPIKTILLAKNPAGCSCAVEIPICVPACCSRPPHVEDHCGLFGRGIVDYEWCCGFRLKVVFRACGDVVVTAIY